METGLLHTHSLLRWIILLLLLIAIFKSLGAGNKPFTEGHKKTGLYLMIACDLMLLIGLVQWFTGRFGLQTILDSGMGAVMKDPVARFFAVEHITMMIIAIILVHIGKSFAKKNIPDAKKHRKTVLYYAIALIIILAAIPWPFRAVGASRGWF
ncbi:MAG TPA: hypothetical protein PK110_15815 [Niabella sp.]|jgi:hypothetical protein|nr:hypothetical protein [Chitinophagaceae bacterium]HRO86289.1 hypothetical protein [Niabella sp.]HUN04440.1 hypothetical protein [Niabella sp.]